MGGGGGGVEAEKTSLRGSGRGGGGGGGLQGGRGKEGGREGDRERWQRLIHHFVTCVCSLFPGKSSSRGQVISVLDAVVARESEEGERANGSCTRGRESTRARAL